jgi:hypothetical protein
VAPIRSRNYSLSRLLLLPFGLSDVRFASSNSISTSGEMSFAQQQIASLVEHLYEAGVEDCECV